MNLPGPPFFHVNTQDSGLPFPAMTEPGHWGAPFEHRTFSAQEATLPAHIAAERVGTVEGLLAIVRCSACGGRHEQLLDFRELANCDQDRVRPAIDEMESGARSAAMHWAAAHFRCTTTPRQHLASAEVERLLQGEFATTEADVTAGEPLANQLLVLMSDRSLIRLPLADLPGVQVVDSSWTRAMAIHLFHAAVREHARVSKTRPIAAVLVGETSLLTGDAASDPDPLRDVSEPETLTVMAATPEAVMLGTATIVRESGVQGLGPGELSPLTFDLLRAASSLTEGLFGTSVVA